MAFFDIVLTLCLAADPGSCMEERLTMEAAEFQESCPAAASSLVTEFAEGTDKRVTDWRCEYPEDLPSLVEGEEDPDGALTEMDLVEAIDEQPDADVGEWWVFDPATVATDDTSIEDDE